MASSPPPPTTLYMPIVPPPTPAPSPPPGPSSFHNGDPTILSHASAFATLSSAARRQHLHALIQECTPSELLFLSTTIAPLLKRDFLRALPPEVSLHILSFIDDPRTLARAARVSRYWNELLKDDCLWKAMSVRHGFSRDVDAVESYRREQGLDGRRRSSLALSGLLQPDADRDRDRDRDGARMPVGLQPARAEMDNFPYRRFFIYEYLRSESSPASRTPPRRGTNTQRLASNWLQRGRLLRIHRSPLQPQDPNTATAAQGHVANPAIPTSIAIDPSWVVVGLANSRIHIFSARTGVISRTLVGHESGVWAVSLITEGGRPAPTGVPLSDNYGDPLVATAPQDAMLPPILRYALGLEHPARASDLAPDPFAEGKAAEPPPFGKPSYPGGASDGWGQPNALVVSGGCDKELRVWDVRSGWVSIYCVARAILLPTVD